MSQLCKFYFPQRISPFCFQDSSYFTVVLEALKLDCRAQGKCLMGATEMGQLAMEYLDDRKFEFNKLEKEIKANMKERERTLKLVRREVSFLTNSFPNLIRKEVRTYVSVHFNRFSVTMKVLIMQQISELNFVFF